MSTTAIQLTPVNTTRRRAPLEGEDDILQVSREADSSAPDGGYGWVIVAAGCMLLWWSVGTTYSWGVIQRDLVEKGLSGPATLSFIGSLQAAMVSVCATANAWLMRRVGVWQTALVGILFMCVGEILASLATKSIPGLFVAFGVVTGFGSSLVFVVVATVPAQYFSTKRGLANGMIFAGSGFGGAAISFALDALIRKVGLPMAFRILAVTTVATGLPAAWSMKERTKVLRRRFIEWSLFKQLNFALLFVASAIGNFPLFVPPFFLPLYTNALGYQSSVGAGLVAGFTLSSAVGRIFCGFWCDRIGAINILLVSLFLTAISMLAIWPASQSLGPLILFVIVNGVSNGGFFSTMPTVASNVFGSARVGVVMGMIITGWVGGYLMGAPIAGYLLEAFGGAEGGLKAYRPAMLYAGSLAVISFAMVMVVRLRLNRNLLAKV